MQSGEKFLDKLYQNLHTSDIVMHTKEKSDSKEEKIKKYMDRLNKVHDIASRNEHSMELLKKLYYDKYVIKKLPESYIELQQRIYRERGYGDIEIKDDIYNKMLEDVQNGLKKSLSNWLDYLNSDEASYPMWFRYYAFQGMLKLGQFDKEKGEFTKRTKETASDFIDINREALAKCYDIICKEIKNKNLSDEEL